VVCSSCKQPYERGVITDHVSKCPVDCVFGCTQKVAPRDRSEHEKNCQHMEVPCEAQEVGCEWKGKRKEQSDHHCKCPLLAVKVPLLETKELRRLSDELNRRLSAENQELRKNQEILSKSKDAQDKELADLKAEVAALQETSRKIREYFDELQRLQKQPIQPQEQPK
jgi:hypothetical protein